MYNTYIYISIYIFYLAAGQEATNEFSPGFELHCFFNNYGMTFC